MINEKLVKAIILVTVMQSLLLVGIEICSFYREQLYIKKINEMQMFEFSEEDFENSNLAIEELNSTNASTYV